MARPGIAWPTSGLRAAAAGFLLLAATAGDAQRVPYRQLVPDEQVLGGGPRVAVLPLPLDDRIAPDDFALDDIAEPLDEAPGLAQDYVPRPAIWRIGDRDTTIWLFGTVHVLPPGFRWRSPALEQVAARADTLLVESVDDGSGVDTLLAAGAPARRLPPLAQRVNPSHRAQLAALQGSLPAEAAAVLDTLPTWIAAVAVSSVREVRAGELPGPGADAWLEGRFRAAGKPVVAIEDGAGVLAQANAIPESEQRRMLDVALDAPAPDRAALRAPLHAWARGEVGPGSAITVDIGSSALGDALLDRRNAAWADSLQRRLALPGRVLFAAGASHFIGDRSVLALLERRGIRVTRVE